MDQAALQCGHVGPCHVPRNTYQLVIMSLYNIFLLQSIHDKIKSLDLRQVHAKIKQVDSHATLGNGIVVQVSLIFIYSFIHSFIG